MVKWIAAELGKETVLHLSRYHPMFKMDIEATPLSTLLKLAEIAQKYLSYVYIGNVEVTDYQYTHCAKCGTTVIKRTGYHTEIIALDGEGHCVHCHNKIVIQ
jgi:pyruvate formate lyase activating enzyme